MSAQMILNLLIVVVIATYLFNQLLEFINLKYQPAQLPHKLKTYYSPEKYAQSIEYHKSQWSFGWKSELFSTSVTVTLLVSGFYGLLDSWLWNFFSDPVVRSIIFFAVIALLSFLIQIPFSYFEIFKIEARFGFNKTTPKIFITDRIKGIFLAAAVGIPLLWIFIKLINEMGDQFWVWFGIVATFFTFFINLFYTSLILPLFNKLTPLEDGELKSAIFRVAELTGFPLDQIMIMDGSKRSTKANAFFSGLGKKKKIVLFDTLIEKHSISELEAVLAHEIGHYKKKHIILNLLSSVIQIFLTLWILSLFIKSDVLSIALGGSQQSVHLNLIAFGILFSPVSGIAGISSLIISRRHEFQADEYARKITGGKSLIEALGKLSVENLANLTPHPLYVFFHYSHPPVLERINRLEQDK